MKRQAKIGFWCAAAMLGVLQVWAHRHDMNPDGISYLEIGSAAAHMGWRSLINGYWSPLYPWILSLALRVFHPSLYGEFTAVHLVNLGIYLGNVWCFEVFLDELILAQARAPDRPDGYARLAPRTMRLWGYVLFLWTYGAWLSVVTVSPDLIVAALAYLAAGLLLRIFRVPGWLLYAALGGVLGAAYLAKAVMFPLAFVFLAASLPAGASQQGSWRRAIPRTGLALVIFIAVAAPFMAALSISKHRLTFGDAGTIAYAEYIGGATLSTHWQGEPAGTGVPAHATRKVLAEPPLYEFSQPIPGSYPPWRDPSYWYEGVTPHFSVKSQARVAGIGLAAYFKMLSRTGALYFVFMAIFVLVAKAGRWEFCAPGLWLVWFPSAAALILYVLVRVEGRYVGGFVLLLLVWSLAAVRLSRTMDEKLKKRAGLVIVMAPAIAIAYMAGKDMVGMARHKTFEPWRVAQGLHQTGIPQGSAVGYIGTGLDAYWAHLGGLRIVAEVPARDEGRFLGADARGKQAVLDKFSELGTKAVVTKSAAVGHSMPGWQQIPGTPYYVYRKGGPGESER